ncbi:hypothetical protein IQ266_00815 [filamentous cyanobacterium LEGE 11480]|uniref:Serine/threonine protein kinase n=1 Tax=Romeriopsis navalis LEGE 11480 TaxID=2777977 RepID=A0A928VGQ4_9CYAN|nr:hypothetical protein [Romeriopsis navalis]MBE9028296.1 hypothetical protein [Romeriopsis navalis LEGE 11480]
MNNVIPRMFQANQVLNDRYQLKQRLGHPAAGRQTWLAQDQHQTGQLVVVKLLVFNSEFNWDDRKLFEREAQGLKHLDHAKIPDYEDLFVADTDENAALHWWG